MKNMILTIALLVSGGLAMGQKPKEPSCWNSKRLSAWMCLYWMTSAYSLLTHRQGATAGHHRRQAW